MDKLLEEVRQEGRERARKIIEEMFIEDNDFSMGVDYEMAIEDMKVKKQEALKKLNETI